MVLQLQCWGSASNLANPIPTSTNLFSDYAKYNSKYRLVTTRFKTPRNPTKLTCLLKFGIEEMTEIVHNKVLIAAGVSASIGQLSKPFTSVLLYDRDFDFKTAFRAGGFPSTHSSSVVAAATSLALDRGFSDSIFGLAVVYASLVMYDAQGVRREVGNHAKALNKVLPKNQINSVVSSRGDLIDSQQPTEENLGPLASKEARPVVSNSTNASVLLNSKHRTKTGQIQVSRISAAAEETEKVPCSSAFLKESIGHTEVEVIAGALLGFFVSMALYTIL